jgi:hypothetical protein
MSGIYRLKWSGIEHKILKKKLCAFIKIRPAGILKDNCPKNGFGFWPTAKLFAKGLKSNF